MGKLATLRLSTPFTEEELTRGHKSGDMVTVLIFASTVPFVWDGRARFLILRQVDMVERRWERIGNLVLTIEERVIERYESSQDMIKDLPVVKFKNDIIILALFPIKIYNRYSSIMNLNSCLILGTGGQITEIKKSTKNSLSGNLYIFIWKA
jgi:hypothetical protein